MGVESNAELDQLIRAGVIRTGGGRSSWYLDEAAYIAFRDSQSRRTLRVTLAVVVAALAVVLGVMLATLSRNR
jgi:hypothetical protein